MKNKVGDLVQIIHSGNAPQFYGEQTVIVAATENMSAHCWEIDIPATGDYTRGPNGGLMYRDEHLKPIPYDGHELCSWEDVKKVCDWTPERVIIYE